MTTPGAYGSSEYGISPYGSRPALLRVSSAEGLNPYLVRVTFSDLLDFAYAPVLSPANYSIPGLTVTSVAPFTDAAVLLTTTAQASLLYTLTVLQAQSWTHTSLDPAYNTATFSGFPLTPGYSAAATSSTRVRLVFTHAMLQNVALTDPASYSVTVAATGGASVPILSVVAEQATDVVSVVLLLGASLTSSQFYVSEILSPAVQTVEGFVPLPKTSVFQWVEDISVLSTGLTVSLSHFSGEVSGGLFGTPAGLVFFSPALNAPVANSVIQVDDVKVCTRAYDTYTFPTLPDPNPLYTYSGLPLPAPTVLGSAVLWAPFPRLTEARFEVGPYREADTITPPVDTRVTATVAEPWDPAFVSLLNNIAWKQFDNAGTPPEYFITANNLAPIPPGPTSTIVLYP